MPSDHDIFRLLRRINWEKSVYACYYIIGPEADFGGCKLGQGNQVCKIWQKKFDSFTIPTEKVESSILIPKIVMLSEALEAHIQQPIVVALGIISYTSDHTSRGPVFVIVNKSNETMH